MTLTPIYHAVVAETGIVPEHIYARCPSLTQFGYPVRQDPPVSRAPRPGQKPIRKKKATR